MKKLTEMRSKTLGKVATDFEQEPQRREEGGNIAGFVKRNEQ